MKTNIKTNFKIVASVLFAAMSCVATAQPLPPVIIQDKKAVVPVTKIQVITTAEGREPVRKTETTVLEMKNQGQDIISKQIDRVENSAEFAKDTLAVPHVQEKSAIVPTSKIVVQKTVTQAEEVVSQVRSIDATGVEFKEGQEPVRKELKLDSAERSEGKVSHAVVSHDGETKRDITIVRPN
ncbi:hypothetical protein EC844_101357 [Acinetobacter calcoaceticus]|uniref:Uncharacterized protein n=1 Tax=Acinetobacter calcoaceticus TaxID=471 RepID=A0A4R1Y7C9_ACICA|nr:hypothetical protein EC844_101357 [Acinetobacter calcoaceticus]